MGSAWVEIFLKAEEKLRNKMKNWVFLIFYCVCQRILKCPELNIPQLRPLFIFIQNMDFQNLAY